MTCDVGIVGAGPAGATAALLFARRGLDVVLVDRAWFPRAKPCGDCVSPETNRVLDRIGVLDDVLAREPARLAGWRITAPSGRSIVGRFADIGLDDPGVGVSLALARERLDAVLLDAAVRAGARFVPGVRVSRVTCGDPHASLQGSTADGAGFELRARLVVGADGLRSVVARRLGLVRRPPRPRKISLTAHRIGIRGDVELGEMHLGDGLCVGLAPAGWIRTETGRALVWNVTLVADTDRYARAPVAHPGEFFARALEQFPGLARRIDAATAAPCAEGTPADGLLRSGSFDVPVRACTAPRVALVGDAAGYYDPFTGQGIHQALRGAELLVDATAAALLGRTSAAVPLAGYAVEHRALVRGARRVQRIIDAVLRRSGVADAAIAWLTSRPAAVSALLAVTGDLAPPRTLLRASTLRAMVARA